MSEGLQDKRQHRTAEDYERRPRATANQGNRPRHRSFLVAFGAVVLVVAIALIVHWAAEGEAANESFAPNSPVTLLAEAADSATEGIVTDPETVPLAERVAPAQQQWATMLPQLQALSKANPDDTNIKRELALAYYNLGYFADAAALYEELLALNEDPVLRNRLGNTLRDMGDLTAAEAAYHKAIDDDPTLAAPYINLAELLWRQGETDQALLALDKAAQAVDEDQRTRIDKARTAITNSTSEPGS